MVEKVYPKVFNSDTLWWSPLKHVASKAAHWKKHTSLSQSPLDTCFLFPHTHLHKHHASFFFWSPFLSLSLETEKSKQKTIDQKWTQKKSDGVKTGHQTHKKLWWESFLQWIGIVLQKLWEVRMISQKSEKDVAIHCMFHVDDIQKVRVKSYTVDYSLKIHQDFKMTELLKESFKHGFCTMKVLWPGGLQFMCYLIKKTILRSWYYCFINY